MSTSVITLTTDFWDSSPYVAVMKGVILSINPDARILDLTHVIRPQDVRHADYFLATAVPYFPPGTIHVCVVDPGVGSDRWAVVAGAGGQWLLAPDNGCLTGVLYRLGEPVVVRVLSEPRFWRTTVSDTFHGRDVFAPVAGHLSRGTDPADLGPIAREWARLPAGRAVQNGTTWEGEVQFVDGFGNLITNVPAGRVDHRSLRVAFGRTGPVTTPWVRTYADAAPGAFVALASSDGWVEFAVVNGSAARRTGATVGMGVAIQIV